MLGRSASQLTETVVSSRGLAETASGGPGTAWRPVVRQERMAGEKGWQREETLEEIWPEQGPEHCWGTPLS